MGAQHAGPMGEHDALGATGRAAREEHDVRVGLPQPRVGWRGEVVAGPRGERRQGGSTGRTGRPRGGRPAPSSTGSSRARTTPSGSSTTAPLAARSPSVSRTAGSATSSTWAASSFVSSGLMGQNTAPMAAHPTTTGTTSSVVAAHTTTRSPLPTPRAWRRAPTAWPRSWISRKVRERSPSAAAIRSGTATAACSKMSPTSSSTFPSSDRRPDPLGPVACSSPRAPRARPPDRPQARHDSRNVVTGGVTTESSAVPSFRLTSPCE